MNNILAYVANAFSYLRGLVTKGTAELLAEINKLEAKIEAAVIKDAAKLSKLNDAKLAIDAAIKSKNVSIDAAYKLLHNISGLVK